MDAFAFLSRPEVRKLKSEKCRSYRVGGENMARYLIVDSRDLTEYTNGRYIQKVASKLKRMEMR